MWSMFNVTPKYTSVMHIYYTNSEQKPKQFFYSDTISYYSSFIKTLKDY